MNISIRRLLDAHRFALAVALAALLLAGAEASAQCPPDVITAGLQLPLGIAQSNQGNLLVSETGTPAPNTGRVSIVGLDGTRRTLLDGLPSGINAIGDPSGPSGLFMRGRTLYVVIGEGDSTIPGGFPGPPTELPNPNPSSPIFSSVLAVHFSAKAERTTDGFTLTFADQQALAAGQKVTLFSTSGDRATIELVVNFPDFTPDPLPFFPANVRHSNPYDLVVVGDQALRHGRRPELRLAGRHHDGHVLDAHHLRAHPEPALQPDAAPAPRRRAVHRGRPDRHHLRGRAAPRHALPRLPVRAGHVGRRAG